MKHNSLKNFKQAFQLTVPVMAGYIFLGITFGLLMNANGFDWWLPILMSVVIYSGALEFAAVPLLLSSFDPISAFVLGITLSARHLFYGIPMLKKYEKAGIVKPLLIAGLTDETFSILSSLEMKPGENRKGFYLTVTLLDYAYWNIGTALGAIIGNVVDVNLEGLDFVLTALFVVLFIEQVRSKTGLKSGVVGLLATLLALVFCGKSSFIIVSMLLIITILIAGRRGIDRE